MTFLQHVGHVFKVILGVAERTEPVVDLALMLTGLGAIIPIYNSTIGLIIGAEGTAATATGTGPQKLAQVTAGIVQQATAWAVANKINWPEAEIQKWASAVADTLNMIPAPPALPAAPAVKV